MSRTLSDGTVLGFEWHGGAYIQVCRGAAFAHPNEVINVWSYGDDGPRIPRTLEGMARKIDDWILRYGSDDGEPADDANLLHDVHNNW